MDHDLFNKLAGVTLFIGLMFYAYYVVTRKTTPTRSTWFIWATLDTISLLGMKQEEVPEAQILGATLAAWLVAILTIHWGKSEWSLSDTIGTAGAAFSLLLWWVMGPSWAVVGSMLAIFFGTVPISKDVWQAPEEEHIIPWIIMLISSVFGILGVSEWTPADSAVAVTFMAVDLVITALIVLRRRALKQPLWQ